MRFNKYTISVILAAMIMAFSYSHAATANDLELSIQFDKPEYNLSESITVDISLQNKGDKPLMINKRFFFNSEASPAKQRDLYFTVYSPTGEKLPFKPTLQTGLPKSDYFIIMKPGDKAALDYKRNLRGYFDLNQKGEYKVIVTYQNACGDELGLDAVKDQVVSMPVKINITDQAK